LIVIGLGSSSILRFRVEEEGAGDECLDIGGRGVSRMDLIGLLGEFIQCHMRMVKSPTLIRDATLLAPSDAL
jgi:hypothetical protein